MSTATGSSPTTTPAPQLRADALAGIAHAPPAEAADRIAAIRAALPSCDDPEILAALAAALPRKLAAISPEVALALGELALELAPHGAPLVEDGAALPPRLRVIWLRAALAAGGATAAAARDELARAGEPLLLSVVNGWSLDELPELAPLLTALVHAADPRLRAAALPMLPRAVQHLALTGPDAFAALVRLADKADQLPTRATALRLFAAVWLVGLSPQALRQREDLLTAALADPDEEVAAAALESAAALELRRPLAERLADEAAPPATRARLLAALGPLAEEEDVPLALTLAEREPLRYGPPARQFLLEAHRRGAFLRAPQLPAVLALFDAHPAWSADELVRVTYLARKELLEQLAALPITDERWLRRAAIFPALAYVLPEAAAALARLLTSAAQSSEPRPALRTIPALLAAAAASADFSDEAALLPWLALLPEDTIPALRAKGGAASAAALRELVFDQATPDDLRELALDALWALAEDRPTLLAELAAAFGPRHLDLGERRFRAARDATPATVLLGAAAHREERDAEQQLDLLCESGDLSFLPEVRRLFRELLRGYVRKALEGDFLVKRVQLPKLEQQVFQYGRLLAQSGRAVRPWQDERPETGRDLLLGFLVEWLAEDPSDAICVALLEIAARHAPDGPYLRALERFWRKGDANVRRAALEMLAAAPAGSHGLELSLGLLVDDDSDFRLTAQALATVKNLRTAWAEPQARRALERREMAVKQEAAEALAQIGTARSVPPLVFWLSRHDNDSFRQSLSRALDKSAGAARVAVLMAALESLGDDPAAPRSRDLLWQALAGHLRLPTVVRLARSQHPEHHLLVEACVEGKVAVVAANAEQVAAALHRARLRAPDVKADPARRLRLYGFSAEAALALLDERRSAQGGERPKSGQPAPKSATAGKPDKPKPPRDEATYVSAVRLVLPSWLSWLDDAAASLDEDRLTAALALALDACPAGELAPRALELAERHARARVEPDRVASFLERCFGQPLTTPNSAGLRLRAAQLLRALPPSAKLGGLRRFRVLAKLGALRTAQDLERALDECRVRPGGAEEATTLLLEALAIPPRPPGALGKDGKPRRDSKDPLEPTRLAAESWARTDEAERQRWLHAALAERPLELPAAPPPVEPEPTRTPPPSSRAELDQLLALLAGADPGERSRAARLLLAWPDAAAAWPRVLTAYLDGMVPLDHAQRGQLAPLLARWPDEESAEHTDRLLALTSHLPAAQLRHFAATWITQWHDGEHTAHKLLRSLPSDVLLPFALERARAGRSDLASLLEPRDSPAMATLVELLTPIDPREADRLRYVPDEEDDEPDDADPVDPIANQSLAALVATIDDAKVERGLAVRAIHALARTFTADAIEPLTRFATDRRPPIRSAALRALRTVAPRPLSLDVTASVLAMETRRDVILQLMASLAHGRHLAALPELLERVLHRDPRIRRAAREAMHAWGNDALPALHREARRARPDHRRQYETLIAELEGPSAPPAGGEAER